MVDFYTLKLLLISRELLYQFVPVIVILAVFISRHTFRKSLVNVMTAFLLGVSIIYPLDFLATLAVAFNSYFISDINIGFFYQAFFQAAFIEESLKFSIIYFFCLNHQEYSKPSETYIYAIAVGLGYAAIENLMYFKLVNVGISVRYLPMFAHLGYALIMATFLNQSMFHLLDKPVGYALKKGAIPGWLFKNQRKKVDDKHYEVREISKRLAIFLSLSLPILFHGIWNILLVLDLTFAHQILVYSNFIMVFIMYLFLQHGSSFRVRAMRRSEIPTLDVAMNYFYVFVWTAISIVTYAYMF